MHAECDKISSNLFKVCIFALRFSILMFYLENEMKGKHESPSDFSMLRVSVCLFSRIWGQLIITVLIAKRSLTLSYLTQKNGSIKSSKSFLYLYSVLLLILSNHQF